MNGCCRNSGMQVLDADGKVYPALIEAKAKRYPEHYTVEGLTALAEKLETSCDCECHRYIPGSHTMC